MGKYIRSLTLTCIDLGKGTVSFVPRHLLLPVSNAVHHAIEASYRVRRTQLIAGTAYELFADMRGEDGNAAFYLAAGIPLGGGKVPAGTPLRIGATATRLSRSPTAWRHILRDYLAAMAADRQQATFASFAGMPHRLPWSCAYMTPECNFLTPLECDQLLILARIAALYLAGKGEQESREAEAAGRDFTPDPRSYPELLPFLDHE